MYHVCTQIDSGARCDKEAAMVKYLAAEMAEKVTSEAVQIHGGAGYTKDFAVERHWRDARPTRSSRAPLRSRIRIISDELLGRCQ